MRGEGACVGLGGTAAPDVAVEVTLVVDWTAVAAARV